MISIVLIWTLMPLYGSGAGLGGPCRRNRWPRAVRAVPPASINFAPKLANKLSCHDLTARAS